VDAVGVNPHVRNTIWPWRSKAHLLRHTRSTVGICSRIDPAFYLLGNERTISPCAKFDMYRGRVAVKREPLFAARQHDFNRATSLPCQAGDNGLVAHKCLRAERASHGWADDTNTLFRYAKDICA